MRKKNSLDISKEAEEQNLKEVLSIAEENLVRTQGFLKRLKEDMEDIWQNYEVSDKETLVLFNTAEAQYQETVRDLSRRERARKKPYFGRIIFAEPESGREEGYYIGRVGIAKGTSEPVVIDWRAPIASVYYDGNLGRVRYQVNHDGEREIDLLRKRTYEIKDDQLTNFYDSDVVATDELLTKYLSQNKKAVLGEIIATIQQEQNEIIRKSPRLNILVQGVAGSGKTTVAMHRISYILYNYEEDFLPKDFYIIGSNRILLNYITSVLPDLDVYGVEQMTMEQLMIRLLYEDWDKKTYKVKTLDKADEAAWKKGTDTWFASLKAFCEDFEKDYFGSGTVILPKTEGILMSPALLSHILKENKRMSVAEKAQTLNERMVAALEIEMQGKNHSFPRKEREALLKKYGTYYGKGLDKVSVYGLYRQFLEAQQAKGEDVEIPEDVFDVYDLAALAYLYHRIKETDPIREASHVVIDEAQDFGMLVYEVMHFCLRDCTYTIMGDVSQNIHEGYGLNDWEGVRRLFLTGDYDCFETLRKSYRNTVEISEFASNILGHGSFEIYPAEPVLRHGNPVSVRECAGKDGVITAMAEIIRDWQKAGLSSIAVICKEEKEALQVQKELGKQIELVAGEYEDMEFQTGVMVLPIFYTKGLEFDGVLLYCPTKEAYPLTDGNVKLLYVAATRALHELCVVHEGNLSAIIETKADMSNKSFHTETGSRKKVFAKPEMTRREQLLQDVKDNAKERNLRGYIGPKHIRTDDLKPREEKAVLQAKRPASAGAAATPAGQAAKQHQPGAETRRGAGKPIPAGNTQTAPRNPSPHEFFSMPEGSALMPQGHTKVSQAVRMVQPGRDYVDFLSAYGRLRIQVISAECVRVVFVRGTMQEIRNGGYFYREPKAKLRVKQEPSRVVMETGRIVVIVEKGNGAVQFFDTKGKLLLKEAAKEPRQLESTPRNRGWIYFDFGKKETLKAQGILRDDLRRIDKKACYISFGGKPMRQPEILSSNGYRLLPAGESTVLFYDTGVYGSYLYMEDVSQLDYYFQMDETLLL